jgi:hypothetical protein
MKTVRVSTEGAALQRPGTSTSGAKRCNGWCCGILKYVMLDAVNEITRAETRRLLLAPIWRSLR